MPALAWSRAEVAVAVGNADAHHEPAGSLPSEKDARPLETVPVVRGLFVELGNVAQDVPGRLVSAWSASTLYIGHCSQWPGCHVFAVSPY